MGKTLRGKNAVVTGGGRGIGRAISLALAAEGANVVVNDPGASAQGEGMSSAPADEVVSEIQAKGGAAVTNYQSVADFRSAEAIIKTCIENWGGIDILVNAAGILRDRMCFNMSFEEWDEVIKVHLYGAFNCSRHACTYMREQKKGRIISIVSDAYRGATGHVNYSAAKGGIVSLMRSMALELVRYGITCNCVAPVAATRMTMTDEVKEGRRKRVEQGLATKESYERFLSMPSAEFTAPAVVYLASDFGSNINGCVVGSAGGKISLYSVPEETHAIYKDYTKEGPWTMEELTRLMPRALEAHATALQSVVLDWG